MISVGVKAMLIFGSAFGFASCWVVMLLWARLVGSYWIPMTYAVACTLLHVAVYIGVLWDLDPFQFPRLVCFVQPVLITYAVQLLAGVATTLSLHISLSVLYPQSWRFLSAGPLTWRRFDSILVVVFPVLGTASAVALFVIFDSAQPSSEGLICDVQHPLWTRLIGYAGLPMILLIPCDILFVISFIKTWRIRKRLGRFDEQITADMAGAENVPGSEIDSRQLRLVPQMISFSSNALSPLALVKTTAILWRVILFHCVFNGIIVLTSFSTLMDVVADRPPTPIGTHYAAFLLAGWAPAIVLGHARSVRRLLFKRYADDSSDR